MAALDQRRQAMLQRMGVDVWRPRDEVAEIEATPLDVAQAEADSEAQASSTVPPPRELSAPSAWVSAATLDWPALAACVADCTRCELSRTRTQTVFGVGDRQARWLVIGEAPGAEEDKRGEPFVGRAGQLLNAMLAAIGLAREAVYIANILKCRPPQNRNPLPDEVARCEPYLRRQVALVQPELILAMGRFAVQSLLGSQEPIGRLRGRVHDYLGVPVVVTYHPAYLLRNPLDKSRSWEDLCLAHEVLRQHAAP